MSDCCDPYSPSAHLHSLEALNEELDAIERRRAFRDAIAARNFALRLRHQPRIRRRLLTWACEEEQRVHAEVAAAICCVGTP